MIFLICSISSISICDAGSHDSVAGVNPFDIIDYSGYLVDDFYYTYYPHEDCKHIDIYIGTKIDILLCSENGKLHTVRCILGDCKADIDTDSGNIYAIDGSIMEFIVNTSSLPEQARLHGDVSYASKDLTGRLISIKIYK